MSSHIIGAINMNGYNFTSDLAYLNSITKLSEEYDEFAQGYWKNLSLFNSSGRKDDSQYKNCTISSPTEYMAHCPNIMRMLNDNFDLSNVKMVRARNLIEGMVIPHCDFVELNSNVTYFRVFVPIEYNADSFHSDEQGVFQMQPGEVWFLDAAISHSAINFSNKSRMFICLDFVFDKIFKEADIFHSSADISKENRNIHIDRPDMPKEKSNEIIALIARKISKENFKAYLFEYSRYHFKHNVSVTACYDWLIQGATLAKNQEILEKSKALKKYLTEHREMGERFTIESWDN
jgi:hypothetical protein